MKQYVITDIEAKALMQKLRLTEMEYRLDQGGDAPSDIVRNIHRKFNYEVVQWLQEIGVDGIWG